MLPHRTEGTMSYSTALTEGAVAKIQRRVSLCVQQVLTGLKDSSLLVPHIRCVGQHLWVSCGTMGTCLGNAFHDTMPLCCTETPGTFRHVAFYSLTGTASCLRHTGWVVADFYCILLYQLQPKRVSCHPRLKLEHWSAGTCRSNLSTRPGAAICCCVSGGHVTLV